MNRIIRWTLSAFVAAVLFTAGPAPGIAATPSQPSLQTWDALPALDPLHLRGPHAGDRVCPMCRYGYDAGVVMLLPADTEVEWVESAAAWLASVGPFAAAAPEHDIEPERFRRFLLFAGGPGSAELEAAAKPGLFVAVLEDRWLAEAEQALARPLRTQAWGYVFAQRRLLQAFDPLDADRARVKQFVDYALQLLSSLYPQAVESADPDLPRGRLWLAPNRLDSALRLGSGAGYVELCLQREHGQPIAESLIEVMLSSEASPRPHWARSGNDGCLRLLDPASIKGSVSLHVFEALQPALAFALKGSELRQAQVRTLRASLASIPVEPDSHAEVLGPCEGCELALIGMPAAPGSHARIAPADAPGRPLRIEGVVRDVHGRSAPGVIVYAYQTDAEGRYPQPAWLAREARAHGALRGWARADASGAYRFDTVRPGAYPGGREPPHVHLHVIEPGRCTYYLDDLRFSDEPLHMPLDTVAQLRGGSGVAMPVQAPDGAWRVQRDVILGLNIAGYERCGS